MGRIFDIQRFSVHDGEGIRTLVFFQGCFLRCKWCCNPESQDGKGGREVSVDDIMKVVERDRTFYRRSGGGITLSGGEVLRQADFARDLLKAASEAGIETAVESTGMAKYSEIEKILPHLDTFLLDIKHTNTEKHKEFTGQANSLALENAIRITGPELIIRVPVIPGFNATAQEIRDIALFAKQTKAKEIHLLPYHRYGEGKYATLGLEYPMGNTEPPTNAEMEILKNTVESTHLRCQIGG